MEANVPAAFEKYSGDFYQMPPMVSAIKQGGVPLHKLARQGKIASRREPQAWFTSMRYSIGRIASPEIDFSVVCSKGFYVPFLARLREALGCGAHLKNLQRVIRTLQCRRDHGRRVEGGEPVDILSAS